MAYCTTDDLKLGNIPLPAYINTQKEVDDAADEIDSKIGYRYQTPVAVSMGSPAVRPVILLLKRINASLASGRLLLAIASPEENKNLHAYAWSMIQEATAALNMIAQGEILLEGVPAVPGSEIAATTPLISNLDSESAVEAFYDRIANPNYTWPATYYPGYIRLPDGQMP